MMDRRETTYSGTGPSWVRRIVVAADGSPASNQGLEQVADLAVRLGAAVAVVFVRHVPAAAMMAPGISNASVLATLDEQESEVRQEALRILGGTGAAWDLVVRVGSPGEQILEVADETDADLVVVGSNRHSSIHNLLLGSTAAYLASASRVPVLVMRSKTPAAGTVAAPAKANERSN